MGRFPLWLVLSVGGPLRSRWGMVPHGLAGLLAKLSRDRHLRINVALHLVLIKYPLDARGVTRAHACRRRCRDARRGGALGTAAVLAYAGSHALDAELARVVAHAGIDPSWPGLRS